MNAALNLCDRAPKFAAIVTLTVLTVWFASLAQKPLKGGPKKIVYLELASTVRAADQFMQAWKDARPSWKSELNEAQGWDTWFICAYAPLFTLLCWIAAGSLSPHFPRLGTVGYTLAGVQLLAGTLDFVENASMQKTIDAGYATAPWPLIGATASGVKWLLILLFALYAIGAGLHWTSGLLNKT